MAQFKFSALAIALAMGLAGCNSEVDNNGHDIILPPNPGTPPITPEPPPTCDPETDDNCSDGDEDIDIDVPECEEDCEDKTEPGDLYRVATLPAGAEVSGLTVTKSGELLFNVKSPANSWSQGDDEFKTGAIGIVKGLNVNTDLTRELLDVLDKPALPELDDEDKPIYSEQHLTVRLVQGDYQPLGIAGEDGLGVITGKGEQPAIFDPSDRVAFNIFLDNEDGSATLFTGWDTTPGGLSRMTLSQSEGIWTVTDVEMLDFTGINGTAGNYAGTMSPWGTILFTETHAANPAGGTSTTSKFFNVPEDNYSYKLKNGNENTVDRHDFAQTMEQYLAGEFPNAYRYGFVHEFNPTTGEVRALPMLGRTEHSQLAIMPDNKTVYFGHTSVSGSLMKFVADTEKDLSEGTLYLSRVVQDTEEGADPAETGFNIEWVPLLTDSVSLQDVEAWIAEWDEIGTEAFAETHANSQNGSDGLVDNDLASNYLTNNDMNQWAASLSDFTWFTAGGNSITGGDIYKNGRFKVDERPAFLETKMASFRRQANTNKSFNEDLRATAAWRYVNGFAFNANRAKSDDDAYIYFTNGDFNYNMSNTGNNSAAIVVSDRVGACGGLYRMPIEANYSISRIEPVLMGGDDQNNTDLEEFDYRCDPNLPAQINSITVLDDGRLLLGEGDAGSADSAGQLNKSIWLYHPE
ncbi:alkaline phosphatase PhoX [Ferrimonas pelagia]|uniref:Uncharacterized protein n=1 Tax=Ferrimonas pelagia TaxID=1177826 RepID=A0ABP9EEL6_9GAMM